MTWTVVVSAGRVDELDLGVARGWIVADSFILGRCWGGIRIQRDMTLSETMLLARLMTLKSALACVPIGGAKIGIAADPSTVDKTDLIARLSERLRRLGYAGRYIPGTDMGFSETDLRTLQRQLRFDTRYTLHAGEGRLSKTGMAVAESLVTAINAVSELYQAGESETVALQGIGNMGSAAAHLLNRHGYGIVAVSNKYYTLLDKRGIDVEYLLDLTKHGDQCLKIYADKMPGSNLLPPDHIFRIEADIYVPGARPLAIHDAPRCKIIAPIANYPISIPQAQLLEKRGIIVIPDIISTAGGAIGSAISLIDRNFEEIKRYIRKITFLNMAKVLSASHRKEKSLIEQAYEEAGRRFDMLRRLGPAGLVAYLKEWASVGDAALLIRLRRVLTHRL
jgi:glutamate dehydrogenase (NAD(P)+)